MQRLKTNVDAVATFAGQVIPICISLEATISAGETKSMKLVELWETKTFSSSTKIWPPDVMLAAMVLVNKGIKVLIILIVSKKMFSFLNGYFPYSRSCYDSVNAQNEVRNMTFGWRFLKILPKSAVRIIKWDRLEIKSNKIRTTNSAPLPYTPIVDLTTVCTMSPSCDL